MGSVDSLVFVQKRLRECQVPEKGEKHKFTLCNNVNGCKYDLSSQEQECLFEFK